MRSRRSVLLGVGCILLFATVAGSAPSSRQKQSVTDHKRGTRQSVQVKVTAYSASPRETQGDPWVTASGKRVRPGIVALSRDLERLLGVKFGDLVVLKGLGTFVFADRLARHKKRQVDIYIPSRKAARAFGVKRTSLTVKKKRPTKRRRR
jgi:3D (Asp-Asp-Asp) domain-containing protein